MTSVRKLASELGVSVATVSRALNNHPDVKSETRQMVLEAANRSGYAPTIGKKQTNVIALAYPGDPVRAEIGSFESALLSGIMRGVNEQKFDVSLVNIARDKEANESYTHFFLRKGIRGVLVRTVDTSPKLAEAIAAEGFPCLAIAETSDHPSLSYVCGDSGLDSERAVEHLIHLGHRRIAIGRHTIMDTDHRDRLTGYRTALRRHQIDIDPRLELIVPGANDSGRAAIDACLALPDPATAIYFTTPSATVSALHHCLELGLRVPQDFSIIGFDDSDVRLRTFPQFTAVVQDAALIGLEAARWMTRSLRGLEDGVLRIRRPTMFSIHKSTGVPLATPVRLTATGRLER